ncbi:hypothetical protein CCACVL1_20212 [Corchorus capsularis]|uniref:Uncharacterized protein n=1 Tax=Corchorus capsularis TaxID=210143 RepID=A0A1R3HC87_COCAP|nr:hypothetical protein CCACVL1_20212 [Corchorus capsularis]
MAASAYTILNDVATSPKVVT